jgi:hypothetical protein
VTGQKKNRALALPQQTEKNGHKRNEKAHWKAKSGSRRENKKKEEKQKKNKKQKQKK